MVAVSKMFLSNRSEYGTETVHKQATNRILGMSGGLSG
jgi:hypothetical protein